jgi:hypothetical protein
MSEQVHVPTGNIPRGLDALILPTTLGPKALMEWLEIARHFLYVGGGLLGGDSAVVQAKLQKAKGLPIIGGMTQQYRARKVSKPIGQAGEALNAACQYLQFSANQLEAAFMPELEAANYRPTPSSWDWNK